MDFNISETHSHKSGWEVLLSSWPWLTWSSVFWISSGILNIRDMFCLTRLTWTKERIFIFFITFTDFVTAIFTTPGLMLYSVSYSVWLLDQNWCFAWQYVDCITTPMTSYLVSFIHINCISQHYLGFSSYAQIGLVSTTFICIGSIPWSNLLFLPVFLNDDVLKTGSALQRNFTGCTIDTYSRKLLCSPFLIFGCVLPLLLIAVCDIFIVLQWNNSSNAAQAAPEMTLETLQSQTLRRTTTETTLLEEPVVQVRKGGFADTITRRSQPS